LKGTQSALTGSNVEVQVKVEGDKVTASGEANTQEEKEKSSWRWATWRVSAVLMTRSP
jgi:hypothetical protein